MSKRLFLTITWTAIFLSAIMMFLTQEWIQGQKRHNNNFSSGAVARLCDEEIIGGKTAGVYRCGELFKRKPGRGVVDAPNGLYSFDGKVIQRVESCGGMPDPSVKEKSLCNISCETINLCEYR